MTVVVLGAIPIGVSLQEIAGLREKLEEVHLEEREKEEVELKAARERRAVIEDLEKGVYCLCCFISTSSAVLLLFSLSLDSHQVSRHTVLPSQAWFSSFPSALCSERIRSLFQPLTFHSFQSSPLWSVPHQLPPETLFHTNSSSWVS